MWKLVRHQEIPAWPLWKIGCGLFAAGTVVGICSTVCIVVSLFNGGG